MATAADTSTRKRLALAIIDYLNTSLSDGTLPPDDRESIEVATSCIADSFKVDPSDQAAVAEALGSGQNLLSIYTIYEKLKGKNGSASQSSTTAPGSGAAAAAAGSATSPPPSRTSISGPNPEAEAFKGQGNVSMQQKNYKSAIDLYTKAINISPTNAIYLSNRAAAYSALQKHDLAKQDAEMAVAADPKYTKAWSRLGLARFACGDAKGSMEAYQKGIDAEGHGGSDAMKKGYQTAKRKVQEMEAVDDVGSAQRSTSPTGGAGAGGAGGMPDLASLAGMFGGGGAGAGGGMPDLSQLMNNPMMKQMAQNLMQNPDMMNDLMSNPRLREMANQYGAGGAGGGAGGGGSMPDLNSLMQDPSIAEMARNFMGGAGGAPPPGGTGGPGAGSGTGS